ncbi:MAG: transcriptional regulator [Nitrospirae bacterium]|jgi:MerR family transcriptional regulator/heat shock protein HspR|nr:transcriptional regulator [Nitrospirota bacterium]MBS1235168.1 transcriptional regulator [Nitrospirota bacterium]
MRKRDEEQPLYLISIVSKMLNVHPQTLRLYEKEGFVSPKRTKKQRLYSDKDVDQLNFILQLTREMGVNRAGVDIILRLRHRMEILQHEMEEMMELLEDEIRRDFKERLKNAFKGE